MPDESSTVLLPLDVAEEARAQFLNAEYQHVEQTDPGYYERIGLASHAGEIYTADFWHSPELAQRLLPLVRDNILPIMRGYGPGELVFRAYKMMPGGHYRMHVDDSGDTGFIWYLNKTWLADWGGLLVEEGSVTVPQFNLLVVRRARRPHFVTEVAKHAREPRLMLVGFL